MEFCLGDTHVMNQITISICPIQCTDLRDGQGFADVARMARSAERRRHVAVGAHPPFGHLGTPRVETCHAEPFWFCIIAFRGASAASDEKCESVEHCVQGSLLNAHIFSSS